MKPHLRVHVIFVGALVEDIDRALDGVVMQKPDRIYLVTMSGEDKYKSLVDKAKDRILKERIVLPKELRETKVNYYNVLESMKLCARIIRDEKAEGNDVYFSLASGGKLLSASITLSCTLFDAVLYYVKFDYPSQKISKDQPIITFPAFHVEKPGLELVTFLNELVAGGTRSGGVHTFSKKDCLETCKRLSLGGFRDDLKNESGNYNKLRIKFLDKLEAIKYITVDSKTRGHITITDEGMFSIDLFATYYGLPSSEKIGASETTRNRVQSR